MTQAENKTNEHARAAFNTNAKVTIEGLQLASTDIAKFITSHRLDAVKKSNLRQMMAGLIIQISALTNAIKDEALEIQTKKQLLKNAQSSITRCKTFLRVNQIPERLVLSG